MIHHLNLKAYGKINLGLDVLRRREDGYHEVKMIMQTVGIYDRIDLILRTSLELKLKRISIICHAMKTILFIKRRSF